MLFQEVPRDKYFHVANGTVIRSVWELESSLEVMGSDTFSYHANDWRNDFSNWVRDVLGDNELAEAIKPIRDKQAMMVAVLRHMVKVLLNEAKL